MSEWKKSEGMPAWLRTHSIDEELWVVVVDPDQRYGMLTQPQWEQYGADAGEGWVKISDAFSKAEATYYVELCWTDMCPKGHRDELRAQRCCGYDRMSEAEYEALSVPM